MNPTGPVVTLGETMMVFNGPPDAPLGVHAPTTATFAGAESNVAIGLARLGHPVRHLTVLGDDPFGHAIHRALCGEGVDVSGVTFDPHHPTGVMFKNRLRAAEPEVLYYRSTSAFAHASPATFPSTLWRDARLIYLTGITPALSSTCLELIRHVLADAAQHKIPAWLDANYRRKLWLDESTFRTTIRPLIPQIDLLLMGAEESHLLSGRREPHDVVSELIGEIRGHQLVLRTPDHHSIFAHPTGTDRATAPALPHLVDPVGAGDAFGAGLLSARLEHLAPTDALRRAHACAALVCQSHGDWEALPTRLELDGFFNTATSNVRR
jgi:2-dehydro-3-deoxygluconokinase